MLARCPACRYRRRLVSGDKRWMPISSCDQIVLCDGQRRVLRARAGRVSGEHRDVLRAWIVLAGADGASNAAISQALGVCEDTVRKWRLCTKRVRLGRALQVRGRRMSAYNDETLRVPGVG